MWLWKTRSSRIPLVPLCDAQTTWAPLRFLSKAYGRLGGWRVSLPQYVTLGPPRATRGGWGAALAQRYTSPPVWALGWLGVASVRSSRVRHRTRAVCAEMRFMM